MRTTHTVVRSAIGALVALSAVGLATTATAAPAMQKCYGINKAHQNDCASADHACKGQASKSRDPDSFVLLPKGVCAKIAGGSTTPGK